MVLLATLVAALLYLVPVGVVLALCSRRASAPWEIALRIPLAVALDLVAVLLLARLVRLDVATYVSRGLWIAGAVVLLRRGERPAWPAALGRRDVVATALAAAAAVLLSLQLSRPYEIWDRLWHTPLVSSLRAQRVPFVNVYEPDVGLHYHFAGDAVAAMVQSLSFGVIHSSLALSVVHDVLFGLTGASLALLFCTMGLRSVTLRVIAPLAILLGGPLTILREPERIPAAGYSILNLYTLSFRPHVVLAELCFVGFAGAVLVRLGSAERPGVAKTAPVLVASTAALAISDEASIGLLGLALGAAWLVDPNVIAPRRRTGAIVLFALAVVLVASNVAFGASFAPGAPAHALAWVPWRSPGYGNPQLPLSAHAGRAMLAFDLAPVAGVWIALLVAALRARSRPALASLAFATVLLVIGVVGLTRLEVEHTPIESHRFVSAALFVCPLVALSALLRGDRRGGARELDVVAACAVVGAMSLGVLSTLEWLVSIAPRQCDKHEGFFGADNLYLADCRSDTGATLLSAARPAYIDKSIWYLVAGCRPVFAPAPRGREWALKVKAPLLGYDALAALDAQMVRPDEALAVLCPKGSSADPICAYGRAHAACAPAGTRVDRCAVAAAGRRELLDSKKTPDRRRSP